MTVISGSSDDIVDFQGDVNGECYPGNDQPLLIVCSDGTVLTFEYSPSARDGFWQAIILQKGSLFNRMQPGTDPEDDYSDHVYLDKGLKWAYAAKDWEKVR